MATFEVAIDGGVLAGRRLGSGPPALVLHGGPALRFTYLDGLIDELAPILDAIAYQQRGLSPSLVGGPYTLDQHVADAVAVLDELGIDRAWIVGHSWGGYLAMAFGALASERALGWVAVDPLGLVGDGGMEPFGAWLVRDLSPEEAARLEALDEEESHADADAEVESVSLERYWPYYFADPSTAMPYPEGMLTNPHAYERTMADAMAHNERGDLVDRLRAEGPPGSVVAGAESGLVPGATATAEAVGAPLTLIPGVAHFPWFERPGSVREAIAGVIAAGA